MAAMFMTFLDSNGDGEVSLDELIAFAHSEMGWCGGQQQQGQQQQQEQEDPQQQQQEQQQQEQEQEQLVKLDEKCAGMIGHVMNACDSDGNGAIDACEMYSCVILMEGNMRQAKCTVSATTLRQTFKTIHRALKKQRSQAAAK